MEQIILISLFFLSTIESFLIIVSPPVRLRRGSERVVWWNLTSQPIQRCICICLPWVFTMVHYIKLCREVILCFAVCIDKEYSQCLSSELRLRVPASGTLSGPFAAKEVSFLQMQLWEHKSVPLLDSKLNWERARKE